MPSAHLTDRGVIRVTGEDARTFLDGLVTSDMDTVAVDRARYAALLTPQGRLLYDLSTAAFCLFLTVRVVDSWRRA